MTHRAFHRYGYRGRDCRNNILLLGNGEIVYFTAAVCVVYNPDTNTQRHYIEHTDDVKSIALHPDNVTVASGQVAGHGKTGRVGSRIYKLLILKQTLIFTVKLSAHDLSLLWVVAIILVSISPAHCKSKVFYAA